MRVVGRGGRAQARSPCSTQHRMTPIHPFPPHARSFSPSSFSFDRSFRASVEGRKTPERRPSKEDPTSSDPNRGDDRGGKREGREGKGSNTASGEGPTAIRVDGPELHVHEDTKHPIRGHDGKGDESVGTRLPVTHSPSGRGGSSKGCTNNDASARPLPRNKGIPHSNIFERRSNEIVRTATFPSLHRMGMHDSMPMTCTTWSVPCTWC
eukprot:scaffold950_cov360-Pavlova_lutheri.AAC.35